MHTTDVGAAVIRDLGLPDVVLTLIVETEHLWLLAAAMQHKADRFAIPTQASATFTEELNESFLTDYRRRQAGHEAVLSV